MQFYLTRNQTYRTWPMVYLLFAGCVLAPGGGFTASGAETDVGELVAALSAVRSEGDGNEAAAAAWNELVKAEPSQLPRILAALDAANPLAANWIRSTADVIADRAIDAHQPLPVSELEKFASDREHSPRARRLAYELLARADKTAPDRLLRQMLDDPSPELRRDAVAQLLDHADQLLKGTLLPWALADYRTALDSARDIDQVKQAAEALRNLGEQVDLARQLGFIVDWKVVGPFDNHDGHGHDEAYPPEKSIDLSAEYEGSSGPVHWTDFKAPDEFGMVDFNVAITKKKGVVGYALARFISDDEQPVEIRAGSGNACKFWLNGKLLFDSKIYHANQQMDQYVGHGTLQAGENQILVKVMQDEQDKPWREVWKFQLRVCDATGAAVVSKDRPLAPAPADKAATSAVPTSGSSSTGATQDGLAK